MKRAVPVAAIVLAVGLSTLTLSAQALSIHDIQYTTTDPNGTSPEDGNIVDCNGGIVIHKAPGPKTKPRLTLYDPNWPDGWGGIIVKDIYGSLVFDDVNVGDWVALTNVEVEDFMGLTFLQYKSDKDANFTVLSTDNPLPKPLSLHLADISAPLQIDPNTWRITDHNHTAEKYEAMLIKVIDVNVTGRHYGWTADNYALTSNRDPNNTSWATDYLNDDATSKYHEYVQVGQRFCGVTGILEQWTGLSWADANHYDYYQLVTTDTNSFTVTQTGDFDDDCDVDFADYALFAVHWDRRDCAAHQWCDGADIDESGWVDMIDLRALTDEWLEGKL